MKVEDQRKKVTQVLYSGLGGHGSVVFSLLNADVDSYFDHSLVFYGIEPTRAIYLQDAARLLVPHSSIVKKKGVDVQSWLKVYKTLKHQRPSIVILHSTNLVVPVAYYCWRSKTKLIVVEHTPNAVKRKVEHIFSRWSKRFASKVILLSEDYKHEYCSQYAIKNQTKLVVINNGIDVLQFAPTDQPKSANKIIISMIARFSKQKDQLTLIKAIQQLNNPLIQLKLAGTGDQLVTCEAYVQKANLVNSVVFCGLLNEAEIVSLLDETIIYVHASLGETMPTSLMQAMACQLPVIGSDIPGVNNLITAESDGVLFDKSNENQLAVQLNRLINDPKLRQKIGAEARKKAESKFSQIRMFEEYKTVINSL